MSARQGSVEATDHLLSRYRGLVEGKARVFFIAGAEPDDVVQEGMIGLIKAIRDFSANRSCSFRSFAELCITRQIISAVKAARRQKHVALNTSVPLDAPADHAEGGHVAMGEAVATDGLNPDRVYLARLMVAAIRCVMRSELSPLEREALLSHLSGLSYRQIGRQLGCRVKRVDNALQRAKKKLARALGVVVY